MGTCCKSGLVLVAVLALGVGLGLTLNHAPAALGNAEQGGSAGPHYTVVETQGNNLLVTDNAKNVFYFYTIDKDKEIGSDLKLRGSVDLGQVGKPEIKVTKGK